LKIGPKQRGNGFIFLDELGYENNAEGSLSPGIGRELQAVHSVRAAVAVALCLVPTDAPIVVFPCGRSRAFTVIVTSTPSSSETQASFDIRSSSSSSYTTGSSTRQTAINPEPLDRPVLSRRLAIYFL
jgi:hypothetical protein